ncbi:hypothetical protein [Falsirhodobacter halotolerans]|uniref:hypothetical protein n=1 Tax=Falsirhodobacter halotolerans TaxID=1146892 RepID=UPI001FD5E6CA|nr:hypothetical protein [Falsirhodobacter halotolerans]MCJ8138613.1 hypothetical protein [Falsirhodobacter halotolerans]
MSRYLLFDDVGHCLGAIDTDSDLILSANIPEGGAAIASSASPSDVYLKGGKVRNLPPRPGPWAVFDIAHDRWTDPRTASDVTAEEDAQTRAEAAAYLADTDWMVIRAAEGGKPVPDDITARRAAARAALSS